VCPPPYLQGPAALDGSVRVQPSHQLRVPGNTKAVVCGVAAVESGFLLQSTPCIVDFNHPDLAAIMVFIEYLTCLEGPFWKQIRGLGLSYSYSISVDAEQGKLTFMLFKSTNVAGA
jgi:Zn-dependent M16 (insulinase) family peptidase